VSGLKRLEYTNDGMYRVRGHGEYTYRGMDLEAAVSAYNEARE